MEATGQYRAERKRFANELIKVIPVRTMKQVIQQTPLPVNTIMDVLNGVLIPPDEALLSMLRVANVSDEDTKRLMAQVAELRESKRRLERQ